MATYKIVRRYREGHRPLIVDHGLTLAEVQVWCNDPETSSRTCSDPANILHTEEHGPWFDGYEKEED